jgi:membrane-bound lytic murein transglycosylase D
MKNIHRILSAVVIFSSVCMPVCYAKDPEKNEPTEGIIAGVAYVDNIPLPEALTLCGETVPIDRQSVRERLDREFTIMVWDRPQVFMWLKRANRYFPYIEQQLAAAGLPDDLKYLAVAESALLSHSQSPAGATGYWQFMPKTGDSKGLRRDNFLDERYSLEHSTPAALRYLKECHAMLGSWALAMAAYNCGEQRVRQMIDKQKVSDYYRLKLPNETERYVFRIAAIKAILENPEKYGYRIPREQLYPELECDIVAVNIAATVGIVDLAIAAGTDYKTIRDLNPQLRDYFLPAGSYTIRVPAGLGPEFSEQLAIRAAAPRRPEPETDGDEGYCTVRPGDTLSHIAERTGVSVKRLQELNGLKKPVIRPGQKLKLKP